MAHIAVGQCFIVGFDGTTPPPDLIQLIREEEVGAIILFRRNIESVDQLRRLTSQLQEIAGGNLLIGIDHEGGRVFRMPPPFTQIPSMRAVAAYAQKFPEERIAYKLGQLMGRELSAAGIHINFAPVLDLDTNANNPIIGDRAFSADPLRVANLGCDLLEGHMNVGVVPCGKHFPGHGDTYEDSHHALPHVPHTPERMDIMELVPFRAAIHHGVPMLMTAHVVYEGWDTERPATLSPRIIESVLRDQCEFDGVVITDDLHMQGIAKFWDVGTASRMALTAGCDLLAVCRYPETARQGIETVKNAVADGQILVERLEKSIARIQSLKNILISPAPDATCIGCASHKELIRKIL
ncbi:MAG: beta-N-acetylhexosaminidase [Deltaproteobacteria bacterium CG11_big_fil_rev_8_21_14_0_20_47_16]|nr:MAG: beta-N-acetylhexosaminidase [Deltaproteobacteria bacterium CG11_big_fil_rev_8_21_14_0_20_47_16]